MAYRLGIDIGGTFTTTILVDEQTGAIRIGKVASTPRDPAESFMEATRRMLSTAQIAPGQVRYVVCMARPSPPTRSSRTRAPRLA